MKDFQFILCENSSNQLRTLAVKDWLKTTDEMIITLQHFFKWLNEEAFMDNFSPDAPSFRYIIPRLSQEIPITENVVREFLVSAKNEYPLMGRNPESRMWVSDMQIVEVRRIAANKYRSKWFIPWLGKEFTVVLKIAR
jgi:hypothetical protein